MTEPSAVTLCMIVRDEASWVAGAVASARALVDAVLVVDTGSTDATVECARAAGAEVHMHPWADDFAAARNAALDLVRTAWVLVLDADEVLDATGVAALRTWLQAPTATQVELIQTTYSHDSHLVMWQPNRLTMPEAAGFPGYIESPLVRLFRRDPDLRFVGAVHENVRSARGERPVRLPVRIHHYGQVRQDRKTDKPKLYRRLARKNAEAQPDDPKALFDYAVASWEAGDVPTARDYFDRMLQQRPQHLPSLCARAAIARQTGDLLGAQQWYERALAVDARYLGALLGLAECRQATQDRIGAEALLLKAHAAAPEHPRVLLLLGQHYAAGGLPGMALGYLQAAQRSKPGDLGIRLHVAQLLWRLGRQPAAEQAFAEVRRLHPDPQAAETAIRAAMADAGVPLTMEAR